MYYLNMCRKKTLNSSYFLNFKDILTKTENIKINKIIIFAFKDIFLLLKSTVHMKDSALQIIYSINNFFFFETSIKIFFYILRNIKCR